MKLVKSIIGMEVPVAGRESDCHLTFVKRRLHIAEYEGHSAFFVPDGFLWIDV